MFYGIGLAEMAVAGAVVIVIVFAVGRIRGGAAGPALALRKFAVDPQAPDDVLIHIVGRPEGFMGWLLTMLRVSNETTLKVSCDHVLFKSASLSGENHTMAPMSEIACMVGGIKKPVGLVAFAAIFFAMALQGLWSLRGHGSEAAIGFFLFAALGVMCLVFYALRKKMHITVQTTGGSNLGLQFNSSVIEGVTIDAPKVMETVNLLNQVRLGKTPKAAAA
jgi:hypothetical protein